MSTSDNIISLLKIWFKWRKIILQLTVSVAIIASAATWFFLKNYYRSKTIFYAASTDVQKIDKLFGTSTETLEYFGTPDDVNRILAIAESSELRDYLTQRFNLYVHYDYDSTDAKSRFKFQEHFKELYRVEKNRLDAVELSIEDTEPEFAQKITLAAREYINVKASEMIKQNQTKMLQDCSESLLQQEKDLKRIEDSLKILRIRPNSQGMVEILNQVQIQKAKQLGTDIVRREQLRTVEQSKISGIYVVEEPQVPLVKSRPKRSILVLVAIAITFMFTTIGVLLLENYRKIDWDSVKDAD